MKPDVTNSKTLTKPGQGAIFLLNLNPYLDKVTITMQEALFNGKLMIHDLSGRLIISKELNNVQKEVLHLSQIDQGTYVFSIVDETNGKVIFRKKMIR